MAVFEELGVRPVINAAATLTRLGGSRMAPEVLAAMNEAAESFVHIDHLQQAAGEVIAEITGAEAGYVVNGAAAGLTLGMAAILAGLDVAKMDRLPDTTGMKNEVVVQKGHRNFYDHAIRAAGAKFVEVGYLGYPGAGGTYGWQIEAAINENTAAVFCPIFRTPGTLPLSEVAEIAHAHGLPVIVDAAAELPPRSNLRRFIAEGADLVAFSGGKAIGGPQSSGILAGRRDLIASVALQQQDMDVRTETWTRRWMLDDGSVNGIPTQGFGRGFKVGREEIVGLVTALKRFAAGDDEADFERWHGILDAVEEYIDAVPGLAAHREQPPGKAPALWIDVDEAITGLDAYRMLNALLDGEPAIAATETRGEFGTIGVMPHALRPEEAVIVGQRIREVALSNQ
ncbi:MAG: aminotransferase class V-fold PLP-dependent enzyme [Thermomicrobiales bacterium]|nr:aminotransferase class V-fold PLP-dependent enzyme [Thermomicrobiales bacterium]